MFIDTSGWFCIFDEQDFRHEAAVDAYRSKDRRVTHSLVIAELVALCNSRRKSRSAALKFIDYLLDDENIEVVWLDEGLMQRSLELLKNRLDKTWSLCDAASFLLMENQKLTEALTTDHHFDQAGYTRLLES